MTSPIQTRVIEWTTPGYEGSFTQYTVFEDGTTAIQQISLRDNMARKMDSGMPSVKKYQDAAWAMAAIDTLIASRTSDGAAHEVTE